MISRRTSCIPKEAAAGERHNHRQALSIARRCVNGFSITAATAQSVTHVSF